MKKFFVLFVGLMLCSSLFAQVMVLHKNDGNTVEYPVSKLNYVDFRDGADPVTSMIGTWKVISTTESFIESDLFTFNDDGSMFWIDGETKSSQTNNNYQLDGNELIINFNVDEDNIDATTIGTIEISGNVATYTCRWNENRGKGLTEKRTMILAKQ